MSTPSMAEASPSWILESTSGTVNRRATATPHSEQAKPPASSGTTWHVRVYNDSHNTGWNTAFTVQARGTGNLTITDSGTVANVANGTYPLSRSLNVLTLNAPKGVAKDFIDFITGPQGQAIVAKLGFVPLAKEQVKAVANGK